MASVQTQLHNALRTFDIAQAIQLITTNSESVALVTPLPSTTLTPLNYASLLGHSELIQSLLSCSVVTIDPTSITLCAAHNHSECLSLLLSSSLLSPLSLGRAVYEAAYCGAVECVTILINSGAPVSHTATDGTTPLHLAAVSGSVAMIDCLLKAGANIDAKDDKGNVPLECARKVYNHAGVARIILAKVEQNDIPLKKDVVTTDIDDKSTPGISPCMSDDGLSSEDKHTHKKMKHGPQFHATNSPTCIARFHP